MKSKDKAITYSLLAHIRNNGDLIKGPLDIFRPLVKRTVSKMNTEGIYKGANISEIKNYTDREYNLDFPIPVLRTILQQIANEVNDEDVTKFVLHKDDSFEILKYTFDEFEEIIISKGAEISRIEKLFSEFKESFTDESIDSESIFKFIEKNKFTLSKFFSNNSEKNGEDYTIEAQFVNFFKNIPAVYEIIKEIYLGSILACYIEYKPEISTKEVELILDTNFIVGLLDLNTPESTHTCRTLIKIARSSGYKISVLKATIHETENLLKNKAHHYDKSFLQKKINPEDVFNACDRRNLSKADLERISDNIDKELSYYKINIYHHHQNYTNEAKHSTEYEKLKLIRNSNISALHDATVLVYVKKTRGKFIKDFEKVNCWFVNNSISYSSDSIVRNNNEFQPETIKADDLLNILWLSNPSISKDFQTDDLINIGLSSTISLTINKNLPKSKVLKELDENLCKYAQNDISDEDIVRIAKRITNKQLIDIEEINKLANENNKEAFINRLNQEADKQKELEVKTAKKIDLVFRTLKSETDKTIAIKKDYETKSNIKDGQIEQSQEVIKELEQYKKTQEEHRKSRIERYKDDRIKKWQRRSIYELMAAIFLIFIFVLFILFQNNFNITNSIQYYKDNAVLNILISLILIAINGFFIRSLYDKFRNHSIIDKYREKIKIPLDL